MHDLTGDPTETQHKCWVLSTLEPNTDISSSRIFQKVHWEGFLNDRSIALLYFLLGFLRVGLNMSPIRIIACLQYRLLSICQLYLNETGGKIKVNKIG